MQDFYLMGCFIAFFLGCIQLLIQIYAAIFKRTRIESNNYHKLLMFYDFSMCRFEKGEPHLLKSIIWNIILNLIIGTLLSWIWVLLKVFLRIMIIIGKIKIKKTFSKQTLDKVKEIELKIKYTDLSAKEMTEYLEEIDKLLGIKVSGLSKNMENEEVEEDDVEEIILEDDDWFRSVEFDDKNLYWESHPSDWLSQYYDTDEYKIEGTEVLIRAIERKGGGAGIDDYYDIKDGVVLKSEILERGKDDMYSFTEETIERCEKDVQWHKLGGFVAAKILKKHLSEPDFRRYVTGEIERVKLGKLKVEELCSEFGIKFVCGEDGYYDIDRDKMRKDKSWTSKKVGKFNAKLEEEMKKCNCTFREVQGINIYKKELEDLLDKNEK